MNRAERLFIIIDKIFHKKQNYLTFPQITVEKDIVYSKDYATERTMDLYFDKAITKPYPILINVHGGGFVGGDKSHRFSLSSYYATLGYFVINANYRLSPKYLYPSAIEDLVQLLDFLPEMQKTYNLDLNKVVMTGDSAGAYYAAHTTAVALYPKLQKGLMIEAPKVKPTALVSFCGPYDLEAAIKKPLFGGLTRVIGESLTGIKLDRKLTQINDVELIKYFSTVNYVDKNWIPTFLIYAEKDVFCKGHAESMIKKFQECGVEYKEYHTSKLLENHCFHLEFYKPKSKEVMPLVEKFLQEHAKAK